MSKISDLIDEIKIYNLCNHCDYHGAGECLNVEGCNCKEEIERQIVVEISNNAIDKFSEEIEYSFKLNGGLGIDDIERIAEEVKEQNNG